MADPVGNMRYFGAERRFRMFYALVKRCLVDEPNRYVWHLSIILRRTPASKPTVRRGSVPETICGGRQNGVSTDRDKVARYKVDRDRVDALYQEINAAYGAALRRLSRGYERDPELRRDLLQEIHIELWRSLQSFDGRCSLRTWAYRVAHNVGASHIVRRRRESARLVELEALDSQPVHVDGEARANEFLSAARLLDLIHRLKPLDRQIMLLYLEGEAAGPIAEVTGLSPSNVATKIHRIKKLLNRQYLEGTSHQGANHARE
jgi:RNA polymerase sigma-70 factor, ECF subfamily